MDDLDFDVISKELTHYLYNKYCLKDGDYIVLNEKKSEIWLVSMISDDNERDDFVGQYELYKGRLIFKFYPKHIANICDSYKEQVKILSSYVDKHCKIVGQLNIRVKNYFLYYYKGEIETGIEIVNQIGNDRLVVRIFKNNIEYAKKEVRDFFSERYFKEVSNKSLHKMTKKERELVSMIYS